MALKIERHSPDYDGNMEPDKEGEWVLYEDHQDMLYLAARRRDAIEPAKGPDWLLQVRAEAAESKLQEAQDAARRWEEAWHEGDAIRTKLQARIDEAEGWLEQCRVRKQQLADQVAEMAEARRKLDGGGWVRDAMTRACPGWQRQFAAHAGDRWTEGDTTADEQLAWVLNRLVDRVRSQGRTTGFEEG